MKVYYAKILYPDTSVKDLTKRSEDIEWNNSLNRITSEHSTPFASQTVL